MNGPATVRSIPPLSPGAAPPFAAGDANAYLTPRPRQRFIWLRETVLSGREMLEDKHIQHHHRHRSDTGARGGTRHVN